MVAVTTFLAIVESGNMARASERLNVTQSTVTARLKALEGELGQTLLQRANKNSEVSLTSHGFRFKRYAEAMADLWQQAHRETTLDEGTGAVCDIGCHLDLWSSLGMEMIDGIHHTHPATVVSAWPGNQVLVEQWLRTNLIHAAITYEITVLESQTAHALEDEQLVLYSTRPDSKMAYDGDYVFVDAAHGQFSRLHARAYAHADIAKVSFGSAVWALNYLQRHGGSAYLPTHLATQPLMDGVLYPVLNAPEFSRKRHLVINNAAADNWPWLSELVAQLSMAGNQKIKEATLNA